MSGHLEQTTKAREKIAFLVQIVKFSCIFFMSYKVFAIIICYISLYIILPTFKNKVHNFSSKHPLIFHLQCNQFPTTTSLPHSTLLLHDSSFPLPVLPNCVWAEYLSLVGAEGIVVNFSCFILHLCCSPPMAIRIRLFSVFVC